MHCPKKSIFPKLLKQPPLKHLILCLCLSTGFYGLAQMDCILGVGGKDDEAITKVFQLTEEQRENLKNWGAELKIRNELLEDRAKYLMKKHEESSPEILVTVSKEYKQLVDSMKQNVRMMDKRLLTTFSDQQYDRYTKLCNQMALRPIYINRSVDEN